MHVSIFRIAAMPKYANVPRVAWSGMVKGYHNTKKMQVIEYSAEIKENGAYILKMDSCLTSPS